MEKRPETSSDLSPYYREQEVLRVELDDDATKVRLLPVVSQLIERFGQVYGVQNLRVSIGDTVVVSRERTAEELQKRLADAQKDWDAREVRRLQILADAEEVADVKVGDPWEKPIPQYCQHSRKDDENRQCVLDYRHVGDCIVAVDGVVVSRPKHKDTADG